MRFAPLILSLTMALAACGPTYEVTGRAPVAPPPPAAAPAVPRSAAAARADFDLAAPRILRVAAAMCRETRPGAPAAACDFGMRLVDAPEMGPNAFQTIDENGRPLVVMTLALARLGQNVDEVAFVLGHETGHHIADHIAKGQRQAMTGALMMGALATLGNASDDAVSQAMRIGAELGGRAYSQSYELEADTLGAYIAARAGFDPERGALIFTRPELGGGGGLLSTHPPSARRQATVAATSAEIRRQQASGLLPAPARAQSRLPF